MEVSEKNSDMIASMPTRARITVNRGAAGKVTVTLNSNICRRSTGKKVINFIAVKQLFSVDTLINLMFLYTKQLWLCVLRIIIPQF